MLTRSIKLDGDQAAEALGSTGCDWKAGEHARSAGRRCVGQRGRKQVAVAGWMLHGSMHTNHVIMSCAANTRTKDAFELVLLHGPMPAGGWSLCGSWLSGSTGAPRRAAVSWPSAGLGRCPACPPATLEGQCSTQLLSGPPWEEC